MKLFKKISLAILLSLGLYLVIGYFLHLVVFPEYKPDLTDYFMPGDVLPNEAGGYRQTIIKQENGFVITQLDMNPFSQGPPLHTHSTFDETFLALDKPVTFLVNEEVVLLPPGERITVPVGVPHKMFNDSDSPVSMQIIDLPVQFAVYLNQGYGYMNESPDNMKLHRMLFQLSQNTQYFDSKLNEGPPVFVQNTLFFLLRPLARLLGYSSYNEKYSVARKSGNY
jgi:mannose-6-phosphate isomerase-like protein (cupin superfamily)